MKIIKSKIFKLLILLFGFGFILGIFLFYHTDNTTIKSYFDELVNNTYTSNLLLLIYNNSKYLLLIWICGIIFFLSILTPFFIIFRGILNGFIFINIIHLFHLKGLLINLILLPTTIIFELVIIILSFYSLNFSIKTFNLLKNNKSINLKSFIKNYFFQFIIFLIVIIINSLIESFITLNILRFVL